MIKIKVSDLLGKYKKTQAWLSEQTNIRPNTISMYYKETIQRINIEDLNAIIKAFKELDNTIKFTDIIDYIEED